VLRPPDTRLRTRALGSTRNSPNARALAHALLHADLRPLKDHPGGTVWAVNLQGRACVCKCIPLEGPRRFLQSALNTTPLARHARNAARLRRAGIDAAEPLALIRGRSENRRVECLVMEHVPGPTVLDALADPGLSPRALHRIAEAVGTLPVRLARIGLFNRDPKPSNLIVRHADQRHAALAVIDCADLRSADRAAVWRTLASAWIEPAGCALRPRLALAMRAARSAGALIDPDHPRARTRALWRQARARILAHGDPTPAHDPRRPAPHADPPNPPG
jgi:tRNA A-37 threonylcarbamoyl transferase component Bud32